MRLHHLQITAFGPFAETATVDFDALAEAGLFLLTGATGAGKTSVLDAVCFALYGEVPGERQTAKRLRSDHAAEGVAPRVALELSLSGRRFRVVRSPAWERPKKRGTGTTTEQASVRFSELRSGEWHQLSSRLDETGHLVGLLVGMNLTQFCQVAMLPQGRFQSFLRARSDERHKLLTQLFRTSRFEDVERWLHERRRALRRDSQRHHDLVADLVSRVSEASDEPLPADWDLHDLEAPAAAGQLTGWARLGRERATTHAARAAGVAAAAVDAEQEARAALEQGRRLAELQASHATAASEHARLVAALPDHRARRERVAAAHRAAAVLPLHRVAEQRDRAVAEADGRLRERLVQVSALLGGPEGDLGRSDLARLHHDALEDAARIRALLPREATLADLRSHLEVSAAEIADLESRRDQLDTRIADLPRELAAAQGAHTRAVEAAAALREEQSRVELLSRRLEASSTAEGLARELEQARVLHTAAVDEAHRLKDAWLHLQEERLNGMAAEIAGALAVGHSCPVCGSADHPSPAPARPGAPDAAAQKAARRRVDDAEAARHAHDAKVRDLTTRLAVAREQAGPDTHALASELDAARARVSRLSEVVADLDRHAELRDRLGREQASVTGERESVALALTAARASHAARQSEADALAREIGEALAGSRCATLTLLLARHDQLADACACAVDAAARLEHAVDERDRSREEARRAAVEAGFADEAAAVASALAPDDVAELERQVQDHEATTARVKSVLADPGLRAAADVAAPDLPRLEQQHAAAETELASARTAAALTEARARRLAGLDAELGSALEAWSPVREDLALATRVAALTDGTSPDNRLHMRLSGYVLAWRLSQVVDAANERLHRMSDQRYSLEHTGRRGAGETRGGLSLLVRDDWSGETRDPATLSGGETFVVSLALALGLADVIAHEVGGADLDTLFVDEGFGSLDADTLDDVMDTLDSLRDGGRVVGVVSHVAEMRDRIPTQLRVSKARTGSTIALAR